MTFKPIITIVLAITLPCLANPTDSAIEGDPCKNFTSCYSCLSQGPCSWCVNKAKCTKDTCGNDNIIYPGHVRALMAGSQFCPRVVLPERHLTIRNGKARSIVVKITQIYMYMVFTPWKCKFNFDGKEIVINGMLLSDEVFCEPVTLNTDSSKAYSNGSVSVLWEYSKAFDGSLPFTVCRCDLDPSCVACNEE